MAAFYLRSMGINSALAWPGLTHARGRSIDLRLRDTTRPSRIRRACRVAPAKQRLSLGYARCAAQTHRAVRDRRGTRREQKRPVFGLGCRGCWALPGRGDQLAPLELVVHLLARQSRDEAGKNCVADLARTRHLGSDRSFSILVRVCRAQEEPVTSPQATDLWTTPRSSGTSCQGASLTNYWTILARLFPALYSAARARRARAQARIVGRSSASSASLPPTTIDRDASMHTEWFALTRGQLVTVNLRSQGWQRRRRALCSRSRSSR